MISLGNIHINPDHFRVVRKDEFLKQFRGKTNICLNKLWALLQEHYEKDRKRTRRIRLKDGELYDVEMIPNGEVTPVVDDKLCDEVKKKGKKVKVKKNIDSST